MNRILKRSADYPSIFIADQNDVFKLYFAGFSCDASLFWQNFEKLNIDYYLVYYEKKYEINIKNKNDTTNKRKILIICNFDNTTVSLNAYYKYIDEYKKYNFTYTIIVSKCIPRIPINYPIHTFTSNSDLLTFKYNKTCEKIFNTEVANRIYIVILRIQQLYRIYRFLFEFYSVY